MSKVLRFSFEDRTPRLRLVVQRAMFKNIEKAAAYIWKVAVNSIKYKSGASDPGTPPHTHFAPAKRGKGASQRREGLKRGIFFAVENQNVAVIGPAGSDLGRIAHTHEFGGAEPPKPKTLRRSAFQFEPGGIGPIKVEGGKLILIRYNSMQQAEAGRALMGDPATPRDWRFPASGKIRSYPPRPFMGPALLKVKDRIPAIWANSVKAA